MPCSAVETDRVDHQRVAFPVRDRVADCRRVEDLRVDMRGAVQIQVARRGGVLRNDDDRAGSLADIQGPARSMVKGMPSRLHQRIAYASPSARLNLGARHCRQQARGRNLSTIERELPEAGDVLRCGTGHAAGRGTLRCLAGSDVAKRDGTGDQQHQDGQSSFHHRQPALPCGGLSTTTRRAFDVTGSRSRIALWLALILSGAATTSLLRAPLSNPAIGPAAFTTHRLGGIAVAVLLVIFLLRDRRPRRMAAAYVTATAITGLVAGRSLAPSTVAFHAWLALLTAVMLAVASSPRATGPSTDVRVRWTAIVARLGLILMLLQAAIGAMLQHQLTSLGWHVLVAGLASIAASCRRFQLSRWPRRTNVRWRVQCLPSPLRSRR